MQSSGFPHLGSDGDGKDSAFKLFNKNKPKLNDHALKTGKRGHNILKKFTVGLIETFKTYSKSYVFDESLMPRRCLTFPSEGVQNGNFDNEQADYILRVRDIVFNQQKNIEYVIEDLLGKGTFGQVARCRIKSTKEQFAVKVIKNKQSYFHQAKTEILLLRVLNKQENEKQDGKIKRIVQLVDFFVFRNHFCLVFETLEVSLYEYIKNTQFSGFSFELIAQWTRSILEGLVVAESRQIIHCDLKPENIMLTNDELKIIDFGSACHQENRIYTYIQSRFYRAPEVILGMKYTLAIDIWSLGCILIELFLGLPIFPGNSEYDQMKRIIDILGSPKDNVIDQGKFKNKYFELECGKYRFKTKEEFELAEKVTLKESKNYFIVANLSDLRNYIQRSPLRKQESEAHNNRQFNLFLNLAEQLLELDPQKRVLASTAIHHPFLNQEKQQPQNTSQIQETSKKKSPREDNNENTKQIPKKNSQEQDDAEECKSASFPTCKIGGQMEIGMLPMRLSQLSCNDQKSVRI